MIVHTNKFTESNETHPANCSSTLKFINILGRENKGILGNPWANPSEDVYLFLLVYALENYLYRKHNKRLEINQGQTPRWKSIEVRKWTE